MNLNTIFSIFTPKDANFIAFLEELGSVVESSSALLEQLFFAKTEEERKEIAKKIKAEELKGDQVSGIIFKQLNETFITPFDREDIHALADIMDDIIDTIDSVAQKVQMYVPKNIPNHALQMSSVVKEAGVEVAQAASDLRSLKKTTSEVRRHCRAIKKLEEKVDALYKEAIVNLFNEEKDTIELIKNKEIIHGLEKAANRMNSARKVLKTIVVKYS